MYSPATGRFLQPDPVGYSAGMNLYAYADGDPLNEVDPSGLDGCLPEFQAVSEASGGNNPPMPGITLPPVTSWASPYTSSCDDLCIQQQIQMLFPQGGIPSGMQTGGISGVGGGVASQVAQRPQTGFQVSRDRPPGSVLCYANGKSFPAPSGFDLGAVVSAGRSGGWGPLAMNGAVGHYGSFDFQRSRNTLGGTTFCKQYQVVSNVAVGAYLYGTGIPEILSNAIEDIFSFSMSSNSGDTDQLLGQEIGWEAAAGALSISCDGTAQ